MAGQGRSVPAPAAAAELAAQAMSAQGWATSTKDVSKATAEGGCRKKRQCSANCHAQKRLCTRRQPAESCESVESLFKYLTRSDVSLSSEAILQTKVAHFKCGVNGCTRSFFASHELAADHAWVSLSWSESHLSAASFTFVRAKQNLPHDCHLCTEALRERQDVSASDLSSDLSAP